MKNWIDLAIQQEYDVYYDVMMNYRYAFLHWQSRLFIVFLMIVRIGSCLTLKWRMGTWFVQH